METVGSNGEWCEALGGVLNEGVCDVSKMVVSSGLEVKRVEVEEDKV
jgi:hypothetical protein